MTYEVLQKEADGWGKIEVLADTFESGKPDDNQLGKWREKLATRTEILKYLETGERYWHGEGYGSEKRDHPA